LNSQPTRSAQKRCSVSSSAGRLSGAPSSSPPGLASLQLAAHQRMLSFNFPLMQNQQFHFGLPGPFTSRMIRPLGGGLLSSPYCQPRLFCNSAISSPVAIPSAANPRSAANYILNMSHLQVSEQKAAEAALVAKMLQEGVWVFFFYIFWRQALYFFIKFISLDWIRVHLTLHYYCIWNIFNSTSITLLLKLFAPSFKFDSAGWDLRCVFAVSRTKRSLRNHRRSII